MQYTKLTWNDISTEISFSEFVVENGAAEFHAMIQLTDKQKPVETQFEQIETAINRLCQTEKIRNCQLVLKRYFVSDAVNKKDFLQQHDSEKTAVSIVQQPPLNGTKISVWLYFVENCLCLKDENGTLIVERPAYKHLYNTQLQKPLKDEGAETEYIFKNYTCALANQGCTLKDNCIRTWIYVQGVDIHYSEMVNVRKAYFEKEGLTEKSHYIASTGIEGRYYYPESLVLMDAYSVKGIDGKQIKYLQAPTHLNPTYEYGVTFERGTSVDYGDRRHIYISGTASIDNKGEIVHPTNIEKQTERTFENIQALLTEAEAGMNDIAKMIVYLRDTADYELVSNYIEKHYPNIPKVIVWAPVCRPGWLIEIECIAIKKVENKEWKPF